ncbi:MULTISPECIES: flagellar basal body-associated FliL family protein [unclassified Gilliamella]|uniref:flagellar basal body-associated FliL family protein n=1 Tax=unclassified Gilliamella TaxID=2685620 RepID=UPI0013090A5B|nr:MULTISPECIES: flagellar basal body-associated FliL family protein [unclassified Gilliamella]MWP49031.1 hypothetical protein [Gilliamella sp. Lep-s35]MWP69996.1 hypothetical protein [Gilliamella sp. Lep-s5]MWP77219.1 hypothetical protein [Gilliamella sp. Lep-s21]
MPTTKKKLSILNLVLILITLLAVGAAAYLWFQKDSHSSTIKEPEEPEVTSPVFLTLKPFTISVPVSEEHIDINKMLYFGIVLRVANENQKTVLLDYLPEVRSDVLLLTSKQYVNNLKQEKGKTDLQEQIKTALSRQYDAKHFVKIDEVLFTDFIIR